MRDSLPQDRVLAGGVRRKRARLEICSILLSNNAHIACPNSEFILERLLGPPVI
jgi:hypothetical protein